MKISLSWLKDVIDVKAHPTQIAKHLTLAGLAVESVETVTPGFEGVVVVRVTKTGKHPKSDKLLLATVTDGVESYRVVCGAPNCREGIKTAYAKVGATLRDGEGNSFEIKQTKIQGIDSNGMLCSGKEIKISDEETTIIEFDEHINDGADVGDIYADTVFDISLTPNLGHCASVIGVARELSASTGEQVRYPEVSLTEDPNDPIENSTSVAVIDKEKCPRYACRLIKAVKIAPSPHWMRKRLTDSGIRPINNVVDVTNYVLLEFGHPLHAFDFDMLDGHKIVVRCAEEGETFVTLDEKTRKLKSEDLLICDQNKGVALGGVMGGQNSEVSDTTRNVLLESAYFQPTTIRRTSKRLGIQTESSRRFERGADPNNVLRALDRATMLIRQLAGGKVSTGVIDVKDHEFPESKVPCRLSRINHVLGTHLSMSGVESIFKRLNMSYAWDGQDTFTVTVPTFRVDITTEVDLIEEAARITGYDKIAQHDATYRSSKLQHAPIYLFEKEVRDRLSAEGLQEFVTCDLIGPTLIGIVKEGVMPEGARIEVVNPTSVEQSILRTSLLPGLLQVIKYNYDHQVRDISGFEVGRIHFKKDEQYKEQSVAGIILTGKVRSHHWEEKPHDVEFYDLKGIVENLLSELGVENVTFKENQLKILHPGRQAAVHVNSHEIGTMGEVHPAIMRRLDVPQRVLFAEFDLHEIFQVRKTERKMEEISVYPASERDWTLTIKEETPIQSIFDSIHSILSDLLEEVSLLDVYRSGKLGTGLKNVTFHFVYRDKNKTVEHEVVETEHARIIKEVESRWR